MKSIVLLVCVLVAVAVAGPVTEQAKIVRSDFKQDPEGGYSFSYESDDGINKFEEGKIVEAVDEENKPHKVVTVRGSFSYPKPDGSGIETINYYADQTGFHAEGESIPKSPARR